MAQNWELRCIFLQKDTPDLMRSTSHMMISTEFQLVDQWNSAKPTTIFHTFFTNIFHTLNAHTQCVVMSLGIVCFSVWSPKMEITNWLQKDQYCSSILTVIHLYMIVQLSEPALTSRYYESWSLQQNFSRTGNIHGPLLAVDSCYLFHKLLPSAHKKCQSLIRCFAS